MSDLPWAASDPRQASDTACIRSRVMGSCTWVAWRQPFTLPALSLIEDTPAAFNQAEEF